MVALAPSESDSKGCSCWTSMYEGAGLGSFSLALSLVAVLANALGLWILDLPATPATNGLVHAPQRSEVLSLLVPRGLAAGVLTAIGSVGHPPGPGPSLLSDCGSKNLEQCSYKLPSWDNGLVWRRSLEPAAQPSSLWPRCS
jgi:hypothetical protein